MARTQKTYSIVTEGESGLSVVANLTADELREEIAAMKDDANYLVFVGEAVPVTVSRKPVITIGAKPKKERKARAKKEPGYLDKPHKLAKAKNGAQPTPSETTEAQ